MIKIAICDDNEFIIDNLAGVISLWAENNNIECDFIKFTDPNLLLEYSESIDLLFLDVEMHLMNGFEVAQTLRNKGNCLPIVFITNHKELVLQAFKVKAFRFLDKPFTAQTINECMSDLLLNLNNLSDSVLYKNEFILYKNIMYIECLGDGSVIHLENKDILCSHSMKKWNSILNESFCQCHQSFIVNLEFIKKIESSQIILNSNVSIPVSLRKKSKFKSKFFEYIKKYSYRM